MTNDPVPAFDEIRRCVAGIDIAGHADHYVCGPRRDDGGHDIAHFGTATPELRWLLGWLKERRVESIGRYGSWKYSFMEESVREGLEAAARLRSGW